MSTYDPSLIKKLQDPVYRSNLILSQKEEEEEEEELLEVPKTIAVPEEYIEPEELQEVEKKVPFYLERLSDHYEEEKPSSIQPDSEVYTISELEENAGNFMSDGTKVLRYIADHEGMFEKMVTGFSTEKPFKTLERHVVGKRKQDMSGYSPDIVEFLRDEDYRIPTLFSNAAILEDAPEDVLRAYRNIRGLWEKAEVSGAKEWLNLGVDVGTDLITDPLNLVSLVLIPVTGAQSATARTAVTILAKESVKKRIQQRLASFATSRATQVAAVGAWTGLYDYGVQSRDIATKLNASQDEIDWGRVFGMTAAGAALGAAAVPTLKLSGKAIQASGKQVKKAYDWFLSDIDKKNIVKAASPEGVAARDLAENGVGEWVSRDSVSFDAKRLGFTDEGSDFIEGVFEVIDDPKKVMTVINSYAKKKGVSAESREEMIESIFSGKPTKGRIAQALINTGHWIKKSPGFYGGKVSTLLDPYAKHSTVAASIQKMFRYDQGRTTFGVRKKEEMDYGETFSEIFGDNFVRYKEAIDPILTANFGWNRQKAYRQLASAVRGKESGDATIDLAASKIRAQLDDTAKLLKKEGLYEEAELVTDNYFPRIWNRKALEGNAKKFQALLIKVGEADSVKEAEAIYASMLDKNTHFADASTFSGSSFLSKRKFKKITDDTLFEEFLDNDANSVLLGYYNSISKQIAKKRVFGATNLKGFDKKYRGKIQEELRASGQEGLASNVEKDLSRVWSAQTGEGVTAPGFYSKFAIDTASTVVRTALLPLATLSSIPEILLNISRGGAWHTVKGLGKALKDGTHILTYDTVDLLVKNHGLTRPEALRKLQRFSIALDQSAGDQVERLSGDSVQFWRKTNNVFFKANLLEPWTKLVQLTSFNVGQDIISSNLKSLAKHDYAKPLTKRLKTKRDELLELNIDIDKGLDWVKRTKGDLSTEDAFVFDIQKGAGRYTNEVILNPNKQGGLRSLALSKNPLTTMMFQLSSYPAAFTNTVLKDLGKRVARTAASGDIVGSVKVIGTVIALQKTAEVSNYVRNALFIEDDEYSYKSEDEIQAEALARWGGNGIYLDVFNKAARSARQQRSVFAAVPAALGPIPGALYSGIATRNPGALAPTFTPLYGILPKESKKAWRKKTYEFGKALSPTPDPKRSVFDSGGIVSNVPNVPEEPDERIDRMTGRPYNEQAGAAFIDNDDDPLERKGFFGGGVAKLTKLLDKSLTAIIKEYSRKSVSDETAEEISEAILSKYKGSDDMPGELDMEDGDILRDFISLQTKSLLDEKHELSMDEIKKLYPEFIDKNGTLRGGEAFSKARNYTDFEIETFQAADELENLYGGDLQDVTADLQYILDSFNVTQKDK